jgi:hypothetical protein
MGPPSDNPEVQLPWGYISALDESVKWETARGGIGGLAAPGPQGLDDWQIPVTLTVAFQQHQYVAPIRARPPAASPFNPAHLGSQPPYFEQPGWRLAEEINQRIKGVLRTNIVVGGEVATTRVTESKFIRLAVQSAMFRASRITIVAQQRRTRGF